MWAPITETLNLENIHGTFILFPSIALFLFGVIKAIYDNTTKMKIISFLIASIGGIGISECIVSGVNLEGDQRIRPVFMVKMYPVEYRPENNRLYIFKNDNYYPVSNFTKEYVSKDDTLFEYHYWKLGNNLNWGTDVFKTLKRVDNIVWYDSLNTQKLLMPDTIALELGEDGFLESVNTSLKNDSVCVE